MRREFLCRMIKRRIRAEGSLERHRRPGPQTRATIRLAESCDIVRMTSHRTSVASFDNSSFAFGVLFCVGPKQDLERLPSVNGQVVKIVEKTSP